MEHKPGDKRPLEKGEEGGGGDMEVDSGGGQGGGTKRAKVEEPGGGEPPDDAKALTTRLAMNHPLPNETGFTCPLKVSQ